MILSFYLDILILASMPGSSFTEFCPHPQAHLAFDSSWAHSDTSKDLLPSNIALWLWIFFLQIHEFPNLICYHIESALYCWVQNSFITSDLVKKLIFYQTISLINTDEEIKWSHNSTWIKNCARFVCMPHAIPALHMIA